ncbi:hypothetical protein PYCC9005_003160 [Savitreella phatthalungensis]
MRRAVSQKNVLAARQLHATPAISAEALKRSEVTAKTDPSVAKQYDTETPVSTQIDEFYSFADANRLCMLATQRGLPNGSNTVTRAMAVSKREGPDFYFLCNRHSQKVEDITKTSSRVNVTFVDGSQWASISGVAECTPGHQKIAEIYSPIVSAWFGDLGDGVHSGGADDPRMCLVKVIPDHIAYYVNTKGKVARMADMATAVATGKVAQTGVLREIKGSALEGARSGRGY